MMKEANFFAIFVGIESPDPETLVQMRKKQNTRRNIAESVHKIYRYGMFVTAGFIVGFDTEKGLGRRRHGRLSSRMRAFRSAWSACSMRCPTRSSRAASPKEGRLHNGHDVMRGRATAISARTASTSHHAAAARHPD